MAIQRIAWLKQECKTLWRKKHLVLRRPSMGRGLKISPTFYHRYGRQSVIGLLIIAMIAGILLPALQTRATSLTWSSAGDFAYNKPGVCGPTELKGLTIDTAEKYTDGSCAAIAKDASLKLAKNSSSAGRLTNIRQVSAGGSHSLALLENGTVWAWGSNKSGQIASDDAVQQERPVQIPNAAGDNNLVDIIAVAAGGSHSLALKSDGTVWAWGANSFGQLGDGSNTLRRKPVQVKVSGGASLTGVTAIAAGGGFSLALAQDGTVWAWGENSSSQLGDDTTTHRNTASKVKTGGGTDLSGVMKIAAGVSHALAIKTDKSLFSWGSNASGQLGTGNYVNGKTAASVKDAAGTGVLNSVTSVSGGVEHTLALLENGTVMAWGQNARGQLGTGNTAAVTLPAQVKATDGSSGLSDIKAISAGGWHSLVLTNAGKVLAWGYGNAGQLGNDQVANINVPVPVKGLSSDELADVSMISAGGDTSGSTSSHSLALSSDATMLAWGGNLAGQLGDGTVSNRQRSVGVLEASTASPLRDVKQLAAGFGYSLILKTDGTLWAWGTNSSGQLGNGSYADSPTLVQVLDSDGTGFLTGVQAIAAGNNYSFALKADGTVWAWGYNNNGQLGDGTTGTRILPVQVKDPSGTGFLTGVKAVTAGYSHTLALKQDGTVWAWGYNYNGHLGDGTTTQRTLPIQVKDPSGTGFLTGVKAVTAGYSHTLALKQDGTVWAWGANSNGQLGDGTTTQRTLPVQVKDAAGTGFLTGIESIGANYYHTLALKADGTVWAWGYNSNGQLGDGTTTQRTLPVQVKDPTGTGFLTGVKAVTAGASHTLALKADGTVWAWGYNSNGQLGDGTTTQRTLPVQVKDPTGTGFLTGVESVVSGTVGGYIVGHNLALKQDGTVWAWGYNNYGQLGDGMITDRTLPVQVKDSSSVGSLTGVQSVTAGASHNLALKADGTVWAWGYNYNGQLGDGTSSSRMLPIQVKDPTGTGFLTGVQAIAAGNSYSFALKQDGTVWAWGYNSNGQLGDGTTNTRTLPGQVKDPAGTGFLTGVKAILAGNGHTLALKQDGTIWAWGYNYSGQLGDGTTTQRTLPAQVKDSTGTGFLTGVQSIMAGSSHNLALKQDGTVWAWGANSSGQLGDGTTTQRNLPIQVKDPAGTGFLTGVQSVTAGASHNLVLKQDGTVWAWGYNYNGQLGDGTGSNRTLPIQVKDPAGTGFLTGVQSVIAGATHTLALKQDSTVWAWGANSNGQLGDGTTTQRTLPIQVKDSTGTGFLTGAQIIVGAASHSLALKQDGTVWAWGSNDYKQTTGVYARYLLPTAVRSSSLSGAVFYPNGTLSGIVIDLGKGKKTKWHEVSWKSQALPAGTEIGFKVRTSQNGSSWSEWSSEYSQSLAGSTTGTGSLDALPFSRFIEIQALLETTDSMQTPTLDEFSVSHMGDTTPPSTNASGIVMKRSQNGTQINSGDWANSPIATFDWTAAEDDQDGSGIGGYCLYLGHDETADLSQTKGLLGQSPIDTDGRCQYAASATHFDLGATGSLGSELTSSNDPYYFSVKAIDKSGNVFAGPAESFSFKYDVTAPKNVAFVSLPSQFIPTKDVTITWPTSGSQSASDANSGVAGLQYRIGDNGTWYGAQHTGTQDASDVLNVNSGSYTTDPAHDYPLLNEGNNIVYFRTIDHAGNVSESLTSGVIKLNTSAPSEPKNLSVTPTSNTNNAFGFSWSPPQTFVGDKEKLTYCYTVNTLPSEATCTFTNPGQTSLTESSYATQPGSNMFYLVARDEAGNINYATAANVSFTANTAAPGVPLNAEIADISIKATKNWKLALSWEKPSTVGAGVAKYQILRSTNSTSGFTQVATTSGTSYVDSGLDPVMYYYKIKACDSANHCGAETPVINKLPTGRFTAPPELIGAPTVRISARGATVSWTTDRESDSRVQIGTESGKYRASETSNSDHTKTHELKVDGLEAGTTYYYKVRWADEDGNVGTSSEQSFTTLPAPVVKNVKVVKSTLSSATIQFTSVDATKVSLQYGKSENFGGIESVNTSVAESTYTVELNGLDDGATYSFRPTAVDRDGFSYPGDTYTFSTPPRPRITNLRFQPIDGEPTSTQKVTWTTNVDTSSMVTYGRVGKDSVDVIDSKMTKTHEVIVRDLEDDSDYFMVAQSRDTGGNLAVSDRQTFRTALDTRPPTISKINVETSIKGTGGEARGQVIVSWTTDEPSTSQVAYGEGKNAGGYLNKTAESTTLTTEHVVIISDLAPSKVYYVQPISKDKANNASKGKDQAAIIGRASQNVLNIILDSLYKVFGVK